MDAFDLPADLCRLFEFERLGETGHFRMKMIFQIPVFSFEEKTDSLRHFPVLLGGDKAGAGAKAAVDLVFDARPFDRFSEIEGTRCQRKELRDQSKSVPESPGIRIRTEIKIGPRSDATGDGKTGIGFGPGKTKIGVSLVVTKKNIEAGTVFFDQGVLKDQGVEFASGDECINVRDPLGHFPDAGGGWACFLEVGPDPVLQTLGFPDIKDFVLLSFHQIDARGIREETKLFLEVPGKALFVVQRGDSREE